MTVCWLWNNSNIMQMNELKVKADFHFQIGHIAIPSSCPVAAISYSLMFLNLCVYTYKSM